MVHMMILMEMVNLVAHTMDRIKAIQKEKNPQNFTVQIGLMVIVFMERLDLSQEPPGSQMVMNKHIKEYIWTLQVRYIKLK